MTYPLATNTWDENEKNAMLEVMESGMYTMGTRVKEFENQFAQIFGSHYAVMVNSGSSANLLAIASLFYKQNNPLEQGDEVIVPAVSWSTTYHPLQQYNLKLRFVDIDLGTLNYDLEALENAITSNTKMIVAVNLLGNPNNFNEINSIIGERNIILIEDNCESMGAKYDERYAGTFGVMGTFSTFFSHHISTMEGGVVLTNDEELYHIMLSLRSHGWTRHLPEKNLVTGQKSKDVFEESFKFVLPGYNLRPGELHGAIGIEQLKKLPEIISERRKNADYFNKLFSNHPFILIQNEIGESSWFGFSLVLRRDAPYSRKQLITKLQENSIECRPIVSGNFLKNPVLKYYKYTISGKIVNADFIDQNGLFVGNHHYNISEEIERLYKILQ
ncbi:MAG: pyridoxamine 5-phosphate oxidase [Bacteroidetes bacterium HGW-Bacteroidetes-12]|nr:MAG: pyridoxamine 5-phosphate oxidase [Bacteroidetes bacterium HGW-Bacteroidetes-12]